MYEDVVFKFEISQWGSAYVSALGAVLTQRDGNFLGSRY